MEQLTFFYMEYHTFAICIALESKKEIVSGLIFDPIKDEMFFAEKNKGAFLNNQRLRVSKKKTQLMIVYFQVTIKELNLVILT